MMPLPIPARSLARRLGVSRIVSFARSAANRHDNERLQSLYIAEGRPKTLRLSGIAEGLEVRVVDAHHYVGLNRLPEARLMAQFLGYAQPGDVIWDVGANLGLYSLLASRRVGETGAVYAFEPLEACREIIRENLALNHVRNVQIMNCALGRGDGIGVMHASNTACGGHRLDCGKTDADDAASRVRVTSGDATVARGEAPAPVLVKIDVEGAELDVVHGAQNVLANPACRVCFVEVHFRLLEERGQRDAPGALKRLLQSSGFKARWIDSNHLLAVRV